MPPRVIDDGLSGICSASASRPAHFQASVARWNSRKPSSVATSPAAIGGSGRPWGSITVLMIGDPTDRVRRRPRCPDGQRGRPESPDQVLCRPGAGRRSMVGMGLRHVPAGPRRPRGEGSGAAPATGPDGPAVPRVETLTSRRTLALQRRAGNVAVRALLAGGPAVQRAPLDPADDPQGYTRAGGQKIVGTGTTRLVVTGLTYGVKGGFDGSYGKRTSAEATMTKQSPDNTAVVIMPDQVTADRPVQVVLHFHGWGFRSGSDAQDPYAGYTVATGGPTSSQGAKGTVRDVDQEHWEQQIGAVARERGTAGAQIVAVLAQGRGPSDFGNVPTFDYLQDVFAHVPALASIKDFTILPSGDSGGGSTQIAAKVSGGE